MLKRTDIHSILIPGSGPIVIGQVDLILNTPLGPRAQTDGLLICQAATAMDVPLLTTLSAAAAAVAAIRALRKKDFRYRSLQAHFSQTRGTP